MQTATVETTTSAPTHRAPVTALLVANVISLIGSMLTLIALPWFVLQTTGSAAKTGITGGFVALPAFVVGVFGGTLVDRLGYKWSSVIADVVSGVGIACVPLLYHTVGLAFWQLLTLVFLGNLLAIPGLTARRAMLPELATLARWRLEGVNASFEGIQYLALLLGPPLAGLLIAIIGTSNVLWLDAASFAVSAVIVGGLIPRIASGMKDAARGKYRDELIAGLHFLRGDHVLLALAICLAIGNMLSSPLFGVILPVFARQAYGSAARLGILVAATGAGQMIGATVYGTIGHRLSRRALWITAFVVVPLPWFMLIFTTSLPLIAGALALGSIVAGTGNPLLVTIRHERIPQALRGRVFSTFSAIATAAQPLGLAIGGFAVEALGLTGTIIALIFAELALGIALFFIPALHDMNRREAGEKPERTAKTPRARRTQRR
ncbi:MAG: MFS transporter [Thermomicrobia bacterium]|nr:MFS transporter [Thermomicrobia bacterium]